MEIKQRDHRIDVLKGILIIMVLLGHYSLSQVSYLFVLGGLFRMPLFIAISCLLVKVLNWDFLKKRILIVLVPYLFWKGLPLFGYLFDIDLMESNNYILSKYVYIIRVSWFLHAIFIINVLYALYNRLILKFFYAKTLPVFILSCSIILFIKSNTLSNYRDSSILLNDLIYFFYLFPIIYSIQYIWNNRSIFSKIPWYFLILIIISSYFGYLTLEGYYPQSPTGKYFEISSMVFPYTFTGNILIIVITACFFILSLKLPPVPLIMYIGRYSFPIFLFHYSIISIFADVLWSFKDFYFTESSGFRNLYTILGYFILYPLTIYTCIQLSNFLMYITNYSKYIGMTYYPLPAKPFFDKNLLTYLKKGKINEAA